MATTSVTKVLVLGGSQNIGYYSALRLLAKGCLVTYLLRNPTCFDKDETMRPYIVSGQARLVKGDALVEEDVRRVWVEAQKGGDEVIVDVVVSSIGTPGLKLGRKGLVMNPPDLCTACMLNVLATMPPSLRHPGRQPKLVAVSSTGLGKAGVAALPLPHRVLYPALWSPHQDKLALERVLAHAASAPWFAAVDERETEAVIPAGWRERAGARGALKEVVVVRPAYLNDGKATRVYRTEERGRGLRTISRQDVAHFIVEDVVANWQKWKGQAIGVGY